MEKMQQGIYTFKQHFQVNSCVKEHKNHLVSFQNLTKGNYEVFEKSINSSSEQF